MSIPGLTDKSKSFREIGRLRKGAPKSQGLKNLRYFRPDFRPGEEAARDLFIQHYGEQPTAINIRLAFDNIEEVWDAYFTVYTTAGMLGKAGGVPGREGWWWIYLRDNKTGNQIVKDAYPEMKFDPTIPVYSYHSQKKNQDIPVYAKPEGKLKVLIPELNLLNYVTLVTHSWYDIGRISENLAGIKDIASRSGMPLPMVKCVLSRRPEMISCNIDGKKSMREEYIINVDVNTDWAGAQLRLMDTIIPGKLLPAPELPALPDGISDTGWDDEIDSDEADEVDNPELNPELFDEEPESEVELEPTPAARSTAANTRPYPPATLFAKIQARAEYHKNDKTATDQLRHIIASAIDGIFDGDKTKRYELCKWLTGKASTKDIPDAYVHALSDWIGVSDYGQPPVADAMTEARAALGEALKASGQQELL